MGDRRRQPVHFLICTEIWLGLLFSVSPAGVAFEPLEHLPISQPERPAADGDLQRLRIGDRLWLEGNEDTAREYYRTAKPTFADQDFQQNPTASTDVTSLSPAGSVYWRNAQAGMAQGLTGKTLVSLELLVAESPQFIPGRIAQIQYLQQTEATDAAMVALENALSDYGSSEALMTFAVEFYAETEQWLAASLAARQFALLNPEHSQQAEFTALADQYWERYQSHLRAELRGNTFANLITGAIGFALTGSLLGPITALESSALLLQGETAVGDRISQNIQEIAPMVEDERVLTYVKSVGDRLTPFIGQDRFNYEYHVIMDDNLNAFALPGGKIFIYSGALLQTRSEAELAGLLAHEISHAALSHGFQLVTQGNLTANIVGNLPFGRIATNLIVMNYSRDMERQADALGTKILAASPYAADGLYNLTLTLQNTDGDRPSPPTWLSTHPGADERLDNIKTQIIQHNYDPYKFEGINQHQDIQHIIRELMTAETQDNEATESEVD